LTVAFVLSVNALSLQLKGHVIYTSGVPVKQARVVFWSFGAVGAIQPITQTDDDGAFSLDVSTVGPGALSASKVNEGYPDAELAFYGNSGYRSLQVIETRSYVSGQNVELVFGDPQKTISWIVIDADTGEAVKGARAVLQASENPAITGSETIREGEPFLFVLPRSPVKIRITAPGYADQSFVQSDSTPAIGQGFSLDKKEIRLQPLH
jgi:hypothetical protein